jgi:flagellar L-ring protein precursor FlgH
MRIYGLLILVLGLNVACSASTHVEPYTPKRREYSLPTTEAKPETNDSKGSLWRNGQSAAMLFTDARALRENDLVVVKVEEVADARRSADTDLSRDSQINAQLSAFINAVTNPNPLLAPKFDSSLNQVFDGRGTTGRTERLTATVPAMVRKVMPNGNLFIEGHRVVLVNNEEQHFYISGVIRPIDIDQENSVKSTMIADAEIEFTGRGVLSDNQRPGFLARMFSKIWPF